MPITTPPDDFKPNGDGAYNPKVHGLNVPLHRVTRFETLRTPEQMGNAIWFVNYAHHIAKTTAFDLADQIDMDVFDMRRALDYAEPGDAILDLFNNRIDGLRATSEACLRRLYVSDDIKTTERACLFALEEQAIVDLVGKTRSVKSRGGWQFFLDHMHEASWTLTPPGTDLHGFVNRWAASLSISIYNCKHTRLIPKIHSCYGPGKIRLAMFDEAHYLTAPPVRRRKKLTAVAPNRQNLVRDLWDSSIPAALGIVGFATPQHAEAQENVVNIHQSYAPGQWLGRSNPFYLGEATKDKDIAGIARWHGMEGNVCRLADDAVVVLVEYCKSSEGYLGAMVNVIRRTLRFNPDKKKITRAEVLDTIIEIRGKGNDAETTIKAVKATAPKSAFGFDMPVILARLDAIQKEKGITDYKLAQLFKMNRASLSQIKSGKYAGKRPVKFLAAASVFITQNDF